MFLPIANEDIYIARRLKTPALLASLTQPLSEAYAVNVNPNAEVLQQLAQSTGLTEQQVTSYFQQARKDAKPEPFFTRDCAISCCGGAVEPSR